MQKYHKGDFVHVIKDLGPTMSHFESDCYAIVIGSYKDQYGGGKRESQQYTIHIKGRGESSWYYEQQLELIQSDRMDLLQQWGNEEKEEATQKSNLDWIFKNGSDVLQSAHGATISALASCLGITNLWGSHGEGLTYYTNALQVLAAAEPFLKTGNKEGWLDFCANAKTASKKDNKDG